MSGHCLNVFTYISFHLTFMITPRCIVEVIFFLTTGKPGSESLFKSSNVLNLKSLILKPLLLIIFLFCLFMKISFKIWSRIGQLYRDFTAMQYAKSVPLHTIVWHVEATLDQNFIKSIQPGWLSTPVDATGGLILMMTSKLLLPENW